ncbi:MAG TPA: hypothetical protein DD827_01045 [Gammaproteobacteria bacterium]|jgi:hypothetical protein|nr:hypothetical protein [Gammaproteobacteria bacterium]
MLKRKLLAIFASGIYMLMLSSCISSAGGIYKPQSKQKSVQPADHCITLNYYDALSAMTEKELMQQQQMLRENANAIKSSQLNGDCNQLYLAMLLSMHATGIEYEEESEQVFQAFLKQDNYLTVQDRQIATLLLEQLQRRMEMRSDLQTLKQQLKKERAASLTLLKKLADKQSKLNQLKNIEKNINQQEQEISTPSTDKIPNNAK